MPKYYISVVDHRCSHADELDGDSKITVAAGIRTCTGVVLPTHYAVELDAESYVLYRRLSRWIDDEDDDELKSDYPSQGRVWFTLLILTRHRPSWQSWRIQSFWLLMQDKNACSDDEEEGATKRLFQSHEYVLERDQISCSVNRHMCYIITQLYCAWCP